MTPLRGGIPHGQHDVDKWCSYLQVSGPEVTITMENSPARGGLDGMAHAGVLRLCVCGGLERDPGTGFPRECVSVCK